jgi:uncharacterized short protein YbdD (DUF466 family)
MENTLVQEFDTSARVVKIAMKNYETYVRHYRSKNLIPMTFEEFLGNYRAIPK